VCLYACNIAIRRQIERPQQLLNFDTGGYANRELVKYYNLSADAKLTGFHNCIGVRWVGCWLCGWDGALGAKVCSSELFLCRSCIACCT
jgi:hypothetical protein